MHRLYICARIVHPCRVHPCRTCCFLVGFEAQKWLPQRTHGTRAEIVVGEHRKRARGTTIPEQIGAFVAGNARGTLKMEGIAISSYSSLFWCSPVPRGTKSQKWVLRSSFMVLRACSPTVPRPKIHGGRRMRFSKHARRKGGTNTYFTYFSHSGQ